LARAELRHAMVRLASVEQEALHLRALAGAWNTVALRLQCLPEWANSVSDERNGTQIAVATIDALSAKLAAREAELAVWGDAALKFAEALGDAGIVLENREGCGLRIIQAGRPQTNAKAWAMLAGQI